MNASEKTSETVLERARVREVTGVFHSRHALDAAAHALLLAGFDRADVDVVACLDQIRERIGAFYVAPEELADVPRTPRDPAGARSASGSVHEIDLEKRPEDLPLGSIRPDPWLGSEPLGRP